MLSTKLVLKFIFGIFLVISSYQTIATASAEKESTQALAKKELAKLQVLSPSPIHYQASRYIAKFIDDYHYDKPELNNEQSVKILNKYIDILYKIIYCTYTTKTIT